LNQTKEQLNVTPMKTNLFFISFIILLGLSTCKKDKEYIPGDTTYLNGYVIDVSTQEPIANAEVQLIKSIIRNAGNGICCYSIRNKIYTDQNGWFEYEFKHHPDSLYDIATTAAGYNYNYASGSNSVLYPRCISGMTPLNKGFTNVFLDEKGCSGLNTELKDEGIMTYSMVGLAPYGSLRVHVKNVPPANGSDVLKLQLENTGTTAKHYNGAYIDEYALTTMFANRYSIIKWWTIIDGQQTYHEDSVFVPKGETANYLLEY
jgi:hypothetical protein